MQTKKLYNKIKLFSCAGLLICSFSCREQAEAPVADALFHLMPSSQTGIDFVNEVADTKDFNIFKYRNFYNGAGVAIGDINNDGLPDIFFTANQQQNRLYLNKGNFQFEDISDRAGIASKRQWHTGVVMADVNADGWLDIYVCNGGNIEGDDKANELFINQKNGSFLEQAHQFGLDDKGLSTHASFFDYDHDGDLDCFVLNNSTRSTESFGYSRSIRHIRDRKNGDRLYKNELGKFWDVSAEAGIYGSEIGFGLGITVGDLNNDGWEDIYVSNDFFERDYLYINRRDGSFKEVINEAMGHLSQGSMGADIADINNDGYLDVFTTEMLPEEDYRLKTIIRFDDYDVQNARLQNDFHHQFTTNCLQLNNKDGTFSEIAQLSGVDATGWSWGALFFDFNNDGWKDIYVCNGISRDLTDQDFLQYFSSQVVLRQVTQGGLDYMDLLKKMPSVPVLNYAFLNKKNLQFDNQTKQLGFTKPGFSNGAAYGDLDNDGDLDLVINNVNSEASIYKNNASEKLNNHYLKIRLQGKDQNIFGIGARVSVYAKGNHFVMEQMPGRGFQSSVEPGLLFGLGELKMVDSLVVNWPGMKRQVIKNLPVDTTVLLKQEEANENAVYSAPVIKQWYKDVTKEQVEGNTRHRENDYVDFDVERLIPKMLSTESPKLAVGDVNGDGLEDFFMSSATGDTAKLFIQQANGRFIQKSQPAFIADKYFENTGAVFFDADGDKDLDLALASGGNQAKAGSPYLAPRLYINDGSGNFTNAKDAFAGVSVNASCIRAADFNGDGKIDLFIGARSIPGSYGLIPSSLLLQNNGAGAFTDVTKQIAPELANAGMVTDAQWADIDRDGTRELVLVGDWMPVTIFKYNGKTFQKTIIPNSAGWWNCLEVDDIDNDGDADLIAGNLGLNTRLKAGKERPARLYVNDFDANGQTECIPVYYKTDGKPYPSPLKGELEMQLPYLKKKFLYFSEYAGKSMQEIFTEEQLSKSLVMEVEQSATCLFVNDGKGNFTITPLPLYAQLSPVYAIMVTDLNNDGAKDIFLAGNFYSVKPQFGRFDASYGTTLAGDGKNNFSYVENTASGLFVNGEARDIAMAKTKGGNCIIVSMNNAPLYFFRKN